jgi:hypothetical protein
MKIPGSRQANLPVCNKPATGLLATELSQMAHRNSLTPYLAISIMHGLTYLLTQLLQSPAWVSQTVRTKDLETATRRVETLAVAKGESRWLDQFGW